LILSDLPPVDDPWYNFNNDGSYISPLVPDPILVKSEDSTLIELVKHPQNGHDIHQLLTNHLHHWKRVANSWKAKSAGKYKALSQIFSKLSIWPWYMEYWTNQKF